MTAATYRDDLRRQIEAAVGTGAAPRGQGESRDAANTVVLAGHFAVFTAGGRANDLLDEPHAIAEHTDMVGFARSSWGAACDAISPNSSEQLLVLTDDIQYVRPALPDRGARERLAAALAADYLHRTPTIPSFHLRELEARGIDPARVVRRRDEGWLFSERALRAEAVERIRGAARSGVRGLDASADGSRIILRDTEHGEHTLVHSGHTSCAGGYLELVMQLHERGVRRLIAVVPKRCLGPVTLGAHLARALFGANGMEVVNIPSGGGVAVTA